MAAKLPRLSYDAGAGTINIDFTSVLEDTSGDEFDQNIDRVDVKGGTGRRQSNFNYIEEVLEANFQYVTTANKDKVKTPTKPSGK